MLFVILIVILVAVVYYQFNKKHGYWKKKGIVEIKPTPFLGNSGSIVFRTRSFPDIVEDLYKAYPEQRYVGMYQFSDPTLLIRDPELIKQITVKSFDCFSEHMTIFPEEVDDFWGKNLFQMKTENWRDMRPVLSPAFTGNKMRAMFILMKECAERFVDYFSKDNSELIEIEMRDIATRFTNDAFATSAFGVSCDSLANKDNEFYAMGKEATDFSGVKGLKFFAYIISPMVCKLFKFKVFSERIKEFFSNVVLSNIKFRKENHIVRPDLIHLLMEAQAGRLKHEETENSAKEFSSVDESYAHNDTKQKYKITDTDIMAQVFFFFLAGFDAVGTLLCYVAYELAINPNIQERLRKEVDETWAKCDGKITYEALLAMKYLDMVVSETLRKWHPALAIDRKCMKPFTIKATKPHEKDLTLVPGDLISIPAYAIQRDPNYYPDPEKFDPERFSDENKHSINPSTYMPFGSGPRNCIGSRFALMECKILFFHVLKSFEILRIPRTPVPLIFSTEHFNLTPVGGLWVGLKKRE